MGRLVRFFFPILVGTIKLAFIIPSPASAAEILYLQGNGNTLDSSGNGNNGFWEGSASYAPAPGGYGFNLTGSNYVDVPAAPGLDLPVDSSVSVSADIDPSGAAGSLSSERIVDSITVGTGDGYLLDIINDRLRVIIGDTLAFGTVPIEAGAFTQVGFVYNGSLATPTVSIYENGVLDTTSGAGAWTDGGHDLRVGADSNGANLFSGVIADVLVSDDAQLPAADVPEPPTLIVLGAALVVLGLVQRGRNV